MGERKKDLRRVGDTSSNSPFGYHYRTRERLASCWILVAYRLQADGDDLEFETSLCGKRSWKRRAQSVFRGFPGYFAVAFIIESGTILLSRFVTLRAPYSSWIRNLHASASLQKLQKHKIHSSLLIDVDTVGIHASLPLI